MHDSGTLNEGWSPFLDHRTIVAHSRDFYDQTLIERAIPRGVIRPIDL
jgi:hypothetical protein